MCPDIRSDNGRSVIVAGVLSQYLWASSLLWPDSAHKETSITFLGETTGEKQQLLALEFNSDLLQIEFRTQSEAQLIPPWVFDYPSTVYQDRDLALAQLAKIEIPTLADSKARSIPLCLAAGINLRRYWDSSVLKHWEWQLYDELLECRIKHGLSLPFLFLTILSHFLRVIVTESSDQEGFSPSLYEKFIVCGGEWITPLGILDPLHTMEGLINCLGILWRENRKIAKDYQRFKLLGFNILQGKRRVDNANWETLIAYCGGINENGRCGRNPLVLGRESHCPRGHLICSNPDCRFCPCERSRSGSGYPDNSYDYDSEPPF